MQELGRNPDAFLALLKEEQLRKTHGRLKIYFGYAPGVGKTYCMLEDAQKLKKEKIDIVVGVAETHGREATQALIQGLEEMPRLAFDYKGTELKEFDLDAALARKPQVILVDEMAHTNAPGLRHEKRWQDIQELLENGIDVFTTLNAQHIETLNDKVAQITRIEVRERVPDSVVEKAFEIELVDLPVDELLQRLTEGKVYIPEQAATALENFFRKGNLIALREIALLYVAQHVDAQMERYREAHRIRSVWPAGERVLVGISTNPLSIRLIRAAKHMATALRADWVVAFVETPAHANLPDADRARVIQNLRLAEQLGGEIIEIAGASVADELIECAKQFNVSKIVVGKPARPKWQELLFGSIVDEVIRKSGAIDVYVITGEDGGSSTVQPFKWQRTSKTSAYWKTCLVIAVCTLLDQPLMDLLAPLNLAMIYLLGVVFVSVRYGRGPSILASVLSVAAFDFFFIPPRLTFVIADTEYIISLIVLLTVALVISTLTARVKQQAELSSLRERRTSFLYSMTRELSSKQDEDEILKIGVRHMSEVFDAGIAVLLPDDHNQLVIAQKGNGKHSLDTIDPAVAQWVYHNQQLAGLGTNTLPGTDALYVPLVGANRMIGVLALKPEEFDKFSRPDQLQLLQTFANQLSQACERVYLAEENEQAQIQMKTEQLRSSLLSSVSHDLRTPLATITGAASSIMEAPDTLDLDSCRERAHEIYHESVRLNRLVSNLLDMTRLQSGALKVHKEWHPLDELIGAALNVMDDKLGGRKVQTNMPSEEIFVPVDATLIQQVLVNLIDNAVKYTPADSPLEITAQRFEDSVMISVIDHGPGIPRENRELIFQKFFREAPENTFGAGLGLAICAGIVEAHGGKIWVEDTSGGGSLFRFTLPIGEEMPTLDPKLLEST